MNQSFPVTQLRRLVLLFAGWHLLRLWTALMWHEVLDEFSSRPGLWYNLASGMFWLAAGLWIWWMLARGISGARKWVLGVASGFTIWFWIENFLLLGQLRANWPFMLLINLSALIVVFLLSNYIEERGV